MWKSRPAQERTCEADWMCVLACSQLKKTSIGCRRALMRVDTASSETRTSYFFRFRGVMSATFRSVCRWDLHSASI